MRKFLAMAFVMSFGSAAHAEWTTITVKSCGSGISPAVKCNGPMLRTTGFLRPTSAGHKYETNAEIGSAWTCRSSSTGSLPIFSDEDAANSVKAVTFPLPSGGITVLQYSATGENYAQDWIIILPGTDRTCEEAKQAKGLNTVVAPTFNQ